MTAATIFGAVNEIVKVYTQLYGADAVSLPGKIYEPPAGRQEPWAMFDIEHTGGGQGSLSGDDGQKLWDRIGSCVIELYAAPGVGVQALYDRVEALVNAYQSATTDSDVWFRNVRFVEYNGARRPRYTTWAQIDVVFDFEYHQRG
jgi:hypothetical protein